MRAFHPEGELAVGRAAQTRAMQLMLSSGSSTPLAEVSRAVGAAPWQQLYPTDDWSVTTAVVERAQAAGCDAIVLTVDSPVRWRNNETLKRAMLADNRTCTACHQNNSHDMWLKAPLFAGLDVSRVTALAPPALTVAWLDRLRAQVKCRLLVKGIVTGEDAALAVEHGADGVIVSNHGGRNEETLRPTIDCVPEVVAAVRGRVPVFVDGGIRRGTDVFKALALGATAVGIGRPQGWGVAAFGQPGVEAVIDILNRELAAIMRQAGTATIAGITEHAWCVRGQLDRLAARLCAPRSAFPGREALIRLLEDLHRLLDIPAALREGLRIPFAARRREEVAAVDMNGAGELLDRIRDRVNHVIGERHGFAGRHCRSLRRRHGTSLPPPEDVVFAPDIDADHAPHAVLVRQQLHQR